MDRRDTLIQAGVALASQLSVSALLRQIVDVAVEITEARFGALGVIAPDGRLTELVTHGVTDEERAAIGHPPVGRGILGILMEEPEPLRIADIRAHPNSVGFPHHHPPMTTFLGVPILSHGHVLGDLYLADKVGGAEFTAEDEGTIVVLAAQASVAIENARLHEDAARREAWLDAVYEIAAAQLAGASSVETLRLIARRARELVGADLATIAIPDATGSQLSLKAVDGAYAEELLGTTFPVEGSVSGQVIRGRREVVIENVATDARVSQPVVALGEMGPAVFVPLVANKVAFGTLAAANRHGGRSFGPEDVRILENFAGQAALAFEFSTGREVGRRLARDLHDGVAQELAFVARRAQRLALANDDPGVDQIVAAAERGLVESRRLLAALTQPVDEPLDSALARSIEELAERDGAHVELDLEPEVRVAYEAREALIRIACEAVSNAIAHASALAIRVRLTGGHPVRLTVADDGVGFDPASVEAGPGSGFGLVSMRERAESLSARFRLASHPGAGTEVEVVLG